MKLFFKHLLRSIRRRPLQPVVLIMTLLLSVAVSTVAFSVKQALNDEISLSRTESYGTADLTVTLNSNVGSRFMLSHKAEEALGEGAEAVGSLDLVMTLPDGDGVFGGAVSFADVGGVFNFGFTEYTDIREDELTDTVLISARLAKERALHLGDSVTLSVFGVTKYYKVRGVSRYPFLSDYDALIDISAAVKAMAEGSVLASALRDDFQPFNRLYIDLPDTMSIAEGTGRLSASADFAAKTVTDIATSISQNTGRGQLALVMDFTIIFAAVLSAVSAFSCLYVLSLGRNAENEIFSAAGARPVLLNFMQYTEALLYWLLGSAFGVLLSLPVLHLLKLYGGFDYANPTVSILTVLKSVGLIFMVTVLTVTALIASRKRRREIRIDKEKYRLILIILLVLTAIGILLCFLLPSGAKMSMGITGFVLIVVFLSFVIPVIIKRTALFLSSDKKAKDNLNHPALHYSLKNLFSVKIIHNVSRLLAIMTVVILCTLSVVLSSVGYNATVESLFCADYVVLNPTERAYNRIADYSSVELVDRVYFSTAMQEGGSSCMAIAVRDVAVLDEDLGVTELPHGNEAIISVGQARMLSIGVGDMYTADIEGRHIEFKVKDIIKDGISVVIFDADNYGIKSNMLIASGSGEGLLEDLSAATAGEMATVISTGELLDSKMHFVKICTNCGLLLIGFIMLYSLIGILDGLYDSYRARREEFYLYRLSGMSLSAVRRMKLFEVCFTFGFGLIIGIFGYILAATVLSEALFGIGYDIFANIFTALFA